MENLAQLKKALKKGAVFEMTEHYLRPEMSGQIRVVQKTQTNGVYTGIFNEPDNPISKANYGKGYWMPFDKASNWRFKDGYAINTNIRGVKCFKLRLLSVDEIKAKEAMSA